MLCTQFISNHITIYNWCYLLSVCKTYIKTKKKMYCRTKNITMENNEFKKVCIKNHMCYYFDNLSSLH